MSGRGAVRVNSDAAASWGGVPPASAVVVVSTGITLTDAEKQAAAMGVKSEWVRAGEVFMPVGDRKICDGKRVKGRQVHAVAGGREGLNFLVWLSQRMEREAMNQREVPRLLSVLRAYLGDERVQEAIGRMGERKR